MVACTAQNATIRDSVCWNNAGAGNGFGLNTGAISGTITLRNVTAVSSAPINARGISLGLNAGANFTIDAKSVIADGTTFDVAASEDMTSSATITLDHSNYATVELTGGGSPTVTPAGSGTNQTAAPAFVDAVNGDFHQLASFTSTIDLGAVDGSSGTTDIDGDPRTVGSAPDIGADEYVPPPPPPPGGAVTPPSNEFTIGKVKGKKVSVDVPGPGKVDVKDANAAKKKLLLKPSSATASGAGTIQVALKLTKTAKKKLKRKGKVKVKAAITFTPTGGTATSQAKALRVKK
jgi:hypothetical protein